MSQATIQVGNIGTIFRFTVLDQDGAIVDISTATTLEMLFQRPDRSSFTRTAVLTTDGTDGQFEYVTVTGDLDQAGPRWCRQGHLVLPAAGEFWTNVVPFAVKGNIS